MGANLYELFHRFYQTGLPSVVGADGTSLFWALVQKSNELRDPPSFTFTNTEAKERSGISRDETFARARQKLLTAGLVQYSPGAVQVVGIYSGLDLDLEPATVAARLRQRSPSTHKPLTLDSQTTHISLTSDSQPTHEPAPKSAENVSIKEIREEHNRPEKAPDSSIQEEDPPAIFAAALEQISESCSPATLDALKGCQAEAVNGNVLTVNCRGGREAWERVVRQRFVVQQALRDISGHPMEFIVREPETETAPARAGPPGADGHAVNV